MRIRISSRSFPVTFLFVHSLISPSSRSACFSLSLPKQVGAIKHLIPNSSIAGSQYWLYML